MRQRNRPKKKGGKMALRVLGYTTGRTDHARKPVKIKSTLESKVKEEKKKEGKKEYRGSLGRDVVVLVLLKDGILGVELRDDVPAPPPTPPPQPQTHTHTRVTAHFATPAQNTLCQRAW